jgi:hypothetical protein
MPQLTDLVWPPTTTTLTYEEHREKLSTLGKLDAGAIIKSDSTVKVTITNGNVYTFSSNLVLKPIKTTINTSGKITLDKPCYGVFEVLYDDGTGFIELDLYNNTPAVTVSSNKLEITVNDPQFYSVAGVTDIFIKILTVA